MMNLKHSEHDSTVHILAKSFGKNLMGRGCSKEDLITAATILIDQAIRAQKHPAAAIPQHAHMRAMAS